MGIRVGRLLKSVQVRASLRCCTLRNSETLTNGSPARFPDSLARCHPEPPNEECGKEKRLRGILLSNSSIEKDKANVPPGPASLTPVVPCHVEGACDGDLPERHVGPASAFLKNHLRIVLLPAFRRKSC
jgi:hypothetical protein